MWPWSSAAHQSCGCKTCNKVKSSGKQKRSLCTSECWQPAAFRTNDRSVVQLPPGALAETEWEIFSFPSHTHNWPRGVSLNPDIQRILCFNMITVWTLVVGGEQHQYTHHLYNSERWKRGLAARVALCWYSGKSNAQLRCVTRVTYFGTFKKVRDNGKFEKPSLCDVIKTAMPHCCNHFQIVCRLWGGREGTTVMLQCEQ